MASVKVLAACCHGNVSRFSCRTLRTTPQTWAGANWREERGLPRYGNEYGALTETPDWSYADGRPAPLTIAEKNRRHQRQEFAKRVTTLLGDLDFAKKNHAQRKQDQLDQIQTEILERQKLEKH